MVIELRQARIFVMAAEELHFGHAAERLYLPQSVVSEQIKRLERSLEVQLFDRTQRSIRLTTAGAELLPYARALLQAETDLSEAARSAQLNPTVITLGIARGMGRRLTQILKTITSRGRSVRTVSVCPARRTIMVEEGHIDAAIIRGRVRSVTTAAVHVWDERLVAAMPEHHPLAGRNSVTLDELATTPVSLVSREENPALHDLLNGALASLGATLHEGIPFTDVESTYAQIAASKMPIWTPMFTGYEAEHAYEGIHTALIEPALSLPTFLVTTHSLSKETRSILTDACTSTQEQK